MTLLPHPATERAADAWAVLDRCVGHCGVVDGVVRVLAVVRDLVQDAVDPFELSVHTQVQRAALPFAPFHSCLTQKKSYFLPIATSKVSVQNAGSMINTGIIVKPVAQPTKRRN